MRQDAEIARAAERVQEVERQRRWSETVQRKDIARLVGAWRPSSTAFCLVNLLLRCTRFQQRQQVVASQQSWRNSDAMAFGCGSSENRREIQRHVCAASPACVTWLWGCGLAVAHGDSVMRPAGALQAMQAAEQARVEEVHFSRGAWLDMLRRPDASLAHVS